MTQDAPLLDCSPMPTTELPPQNEQAPVIEPARPEDASAIAHVRHETWLATYPHEATGITRADILAQELESPDQVARWRKGILDQTGTRKIWVARNTHGEVVGYGQGKKGEHEHAIWGLYILPSEQGKGLGRELLRTVLDWLGNDLPVSLSVAEYATSAIALYERFGFVAASEPGFGPSFASGNTIPSLKMVRLAQKEKRLP